MYVLGLTCIRSGEGLLDRALLASEGSASMPLSAVLNLSSEANRTDLAGLMKDRSCGLPFGFNFLSLYTATSFSNAALLSLTYCRRASGRLPAWTVSREERISAYVLQ